MPKCTKEKELLIVTDDKVGMFAELSALLARENINITALCAYSMEGKAYFMLLAKDHEKAKTVLSAQGWSVQESDVAYIEVHNQVGAGNKIAEQLKNKNINIAYCYGTTSIFSTDCPCGLVVKADNIDDVLDAID